MPRRALINKKEEGTGPNYWVAAKEFKLSYHNFKIILISIIYIHILW